MGSGPWRKGPPVRAAGDPHQPSSPAHAPPENPEPGSSPPAAAAGPHQIPTWSPPGPHQDPTRTPTGRIRREGSRQGSQAAVAFSLPAPAAKSTHRVGKDRERMTGTQSALLPCAKKCPFQTTGEEGLGRQGSRALGLAEHPGENSELKK